METIIRKKTSVEKMKKTFYADGGNIRFYDIPRLRRKSSLEPLNEIEVFEIMIRHSEDEDPKKIFNDIYKKANKGGIYELSRLGGFK